MKVRLDCWSDQPHLSQVYTGLAMLHRAGEIELQQKVSAPPPLNTDPECPPHLVDAKTGLCTVESNGFRYCIDVCDTHEIDAEALESCDVYLKRSYAREPMSAKVRPLGLNYRVFADGFDFFELERRLRMAGWKQAARYLGRRQLTVSDFEADVPNGEPRVLFLCRTWESEPERGPASAARALINDSRAECITALRKAFGDRCIAGFSPSAHALAHYPQAVVTDPSITERRRYVQLMRSTPICVATLGLHRSNGWKLAEYIASSRAIVCEELHHDVPNLLPGRNFLPFKNASECVERVGELMESSAQRTAIAKANRLYYLAYLRPDRLMANALSEILAPRPQPAAGGLSPHVPP